MLTFAARLGYNCVCVGRSSLSGRVSHFESESDRKPDLQPSDDSNFLRIQTNPAILQRICWYNWRTRLCSLLVSTNCYLINMTMGGTELQWLAQLPYSHEVVGLIPVQVEQGSPGRGSLASSWRPLMTALWPGAVCLWRCSVFQMFLPSQKDQREQTHIRSVSPGRGLTPFKVVVVVLAGSITRPPNNTDKNLPRQESQ